MIITALAIGIAVIGLPAALLGISLQRDDITEKMFRLRAKWGCR